MKRPKRLLLSTVTLVSFVAGLWLVSSGVRTLRYASIRTYDLHRKLVEGFRSLPPTPAVHRRLVSTAEHQIDELDGWRDILAAHGKLHLGGGLVFLAVFAMTLVERRRLLGREAKGPGEQPPS